MQVCKETHQGECLEHYGAIGRPTHCERHCEMVRDIQIYLVITVHRLGLQNLSGHFYGRYCAL
jgi:hypothetical protein